MRKSLLFVGLVLLWTCSSNASGGLIYGRVAFDGSICDNCASEPVTSNLFGYVRWIDFLPFVDLNIGFDYVHSSTDACGKVDFTAYTVHASGNLTLISLGLVKVYAGGGLSYNYLRYSGGDCDEHLSRSEMGYHGLAGLRSTFPASPLNGFIEARLSRVGSGDPLTMKSIRFGLEISLGG